MFEVVPSAARSNASGPVTCATPVRRGSVAPRLRATRGDRSTPAFCPDLPFEIPGDGRFARGGLVPPTSCRRAVAPRTAGSRVQGRGRPAPHQRISSGSERSRNASLCFTRKRLQCRHSRSAFTAHDDYALSLLGTRNSLRLATTTRGRG
jgi:hypothetical protein